jgi:hypothetical protein
MPDSSPTFKAKAASSNGFCIFPRSKKPKSPFCDAEEQSDLFFAISSNDARPETISFLIFEISFNASCFDKVMFGFLHEAGRREPACLHKMWLALTWLGESEFEDMVGRVQVDSEDFVLK